ncbi:MAG: hypothetical protein ACREQM_21370 [Candidatus Dormibacteraceae bacterium]
MHPRADDPRAQEEPDEPEEPETEPEAPRQAASPLVVAASGGPGVEFEYRTEQLTAEQVLDGTTLPSLLAKESADGWDLVELLEVQAAHVVLLRKPRKPEREGRRVGFIGR